MNHFDMYDAILQILAGILDKTDAFIKTLCVFLGGDANTFLPEGRLNEMDRLFHTQFAETPAAVFPGGYNPPDADFRKFFLLSRIRRQPANCPLSQSSRCHAS